MVCISTPLIYFFSSKNIHSPFLHSYLHSPPTFYFVFFSISSATACVTTLDLSTRSAPYRLLWHRFWQHYYYPPRRTPFPLFALSWSFLLRYGFSSVPRLPLLPSPCRQRHWVSVCRSKSNVVAEKNSMHASYALCSLPPPRAQGVMFLPLAPFHHV